MSKKVDDFPHAIQELDKLTAAQRSLVYAGREGILPVTPPSGSEPERGLDLMNHL